MHRTTTRILYRCALLALVFIAGLLSRPWTERILALGGRGTGPIPETTANQARAEPRHNSTEPGKWRRARHAAPEGLSQEEARLLALPYLQGYRPAADEPIISAHEPERSYEGLNLVVSGHAPEALLTDMRGRVLHRWHYDLRRLWPDLYAGEGAETIRKLEYWRRAHLLPDGSLLAIFEGLGLIKLDAASRLQWFYRAGAHHDLALTAEGNIWVLDREGKVIPRIHPDRGVLEDFLTLLDGQGKVLRKISVLESLERSDYAPLLRRRPAAGDIFHTNTLELLDGSSESRHPAWRAGNLLISIRELDTVAVVDPREERVVWALTGQWHKQHQPTLLDSGNLLIFDNLGATGRHSRVLEIDPLTRRVVWSYSGGPEVDFLSKTLGSCQRLPNGNTLITESENGRAFETTSDGEIVWEFYNPHRAGEEGELIAVLFEVIRLSLDDEGAAAAMALSQK